MPLTDRRMLDALLAAYPSGSIAVVDRQGRFVCAGGSRLEDRGLTPEQVVGRTAVELFGEALGGRMNAGYERCFAGEAYVDQQSIGGRHFQVSHQPIVEDGEVIGAVVVTVDISPARAERARRVETEQRYASLVSEFPGATYLFDGDYRYLIAGGRALSNLGFDAATLVGRTPREVLGDVIGERIEGWIDRALAGEEVQVDVDQGDQVFELRFVRVPEEYLVVSMAVDVTAARSSKRRIEEDLLRQEALLREVHHRVKNHLQVVQSLLGMTARRVRSEAARRSLLDVRARLQSMAVVHTELYRQPADGTVRVDIFLERLLAHLRRGLPSVGRAAFACSLDPLEASNDVALHLGLVLTELVTNAGEHALPRSSKPRLRVALTVEAGDVELIVEDSGPGVDLDTAGEDSLGLWLVRTLTEAHSGTLVCEPGAGGGAQFRVTLSLDPAVAQVDGP